MREFPNSPIYIEIFLFIGYWTPRSLRPSIKKEENLPFKEISIDEIDFL